MRRFWVLFCKRGLAFSVFGPIVMAIVYAILGATGAVETLAPFEVAKGITTVSLMAFVAAGIPTIYEIEQLSLMWAILIHGIVLYCDYILIYLVNGWLKSQLVPILIFTGVFVVGFALCWLFIYLGIRAKTGDLNAALREKQGRN